MSAPGATKVLVVQVNAFPVVQAMPVTFVKGDFINEPPKGEPRAYACPVDMNGTTDAGIAAAVAKRWPGFGEWWRRQRKQIGDVAVFEAEGGRDLIFALVIQRGSKRGKQGGRSRNRNDRNLVAHAECHQAVAGV